MSRGHEQNKGDMYGMATKKTTTNFGFAKDAWEEIKNSGMEKKF
jgi:hypothetical protein